MQELKTLEELKEKHPVKTPIQVAAKFMEVTPRFLQVGLQQGRFNFGVAVEMKNWSYWVNTIRFINYMKGV